MSTTEYVTIIPSTESNVLYPEVMSTAEYVTIVPSTDIIVLYPEVMSTTEYVTIVPSTESKVDFSIRKNPQPEKVS